MRRLEKLYFLSRPLVFYAPAREIDPTQREEAEAITWQRMKRNHR